MDHPAPCPDAALSRPGTSTRADFNTVEDFIASDAFDEAVLRAAKRGVELAMAQEEAMRAKAASTAAGG